MTKSETALWNSIRTARSSAHHPMIRGLSTWLVIGEDRLARVASSSERCGRAWTLNKLRQAATNIEKALAANNRGTA